jgi:glycosyltransferase involved in cell wall biosynthesis
MDISVVISTHQRPSSLAETLRCLAHADVTGLTTEVIVVNSDPLDHTREVVESFSHLLKATHLCEPTRGTYGKSHALNRALDRSGLGDIIAVLDDDMSPHADWFQGVAAISRRWPGKDFFTGKSYIVWPCTPAPAWAASPRLAGWVFSVMDWGSQDLPVKSSTSFFSGNHFWFRSRVLANRRRFPDVLATEAAFMLMLNEDGFQGLYGPDAVTGHRVQKELLDPAHVLARALKIGAALSEVRLMPEFTKLKHVQAFARHPVLTRLFCAANWLRWTSALYLPWFCPGKDHPFAKKAHALERQSAFRAFLSLAAQRPEYACFTRLPPPRQPRP